ncbi:MAG: hypothetical protein K6G75_08985 [Lachnospiraceae bacterium]|nr:hypothetical protein [Lachnospiraceae bacterium]
MYYEIEYTRKIRFDTLEEAEKELENLMIKYGENDNYRIRDSIWYPNPDYIEGVVKYRYKRTLFRSYELVNGKLKRKESITGKPFFR